MPIYAIQCADQTHQECEEEVRVRLDIVGLTEDQIESLEHGRSIELTPQQVQGSDLYLTEVQRSELEAKGFVRYAIDLDSICEACGGDLIVDVDEHLGASSEPQ